MYNKTFKHKKHVNFSKHYDNTDTHTRDRERESLHLNTFLVFQLIHEGMVLVDQSSFCRIYPAKAQFQTCSFYPSLVPQEEFSGAQQQMLGQTGKIQVSAKNIQGKRQKTE